MRLADVPAGTFGPYVADTRDGALVVWAAPAAGGRAWWSLRIDASGKPLAKPVKVAPAPNEVGLAIVEPRRAGEGSGGFVLLYTRRDGAKSRLESLSLADKGALAGGPDGIAETEAELLWIDLVPTSREPLVFWGARQGTGADLFARALGAGEKSPAAQVAKGARAWQAASFGSGAAVGSVTAGRVEVVSLDPAAKLGERTSLTEAATAEADLDMVTSGDGLLLAWSDRKELDSRVVVAALDRAGKLARPPAPAVSSIGEQLLVRLVAPHAGRGPAYLAWESLQDRPAFGREIQLTPLAADGVAGSARIALVHASNESVPELVATQKGLAALALAPRCRKGQDCSAAALVPTFVELDQSLALRSSEPLRMSALGGEAPDLAWGLSCVRPQCWLLAAQASDPAPVYAVKLEALAPDFVPAAHAVTVSAPPRVSALEAIAGVDPLADVALAKVGSGMLAGWVTYFDPSAP